MIILDTNVLSELIHPKGSIRIVEWMDRQAPDLLCTTSLTVCEMVFGLTIKQASARMRLVEQRFYLTLSILVGDRILPFDRVASEEAARFAAQRKLAGRMIDLADTQIAGIALANKARLASRNIRHFEDAGIDLINPWAIGS